MDFRPPKGGFRKKSGLEGDATPTTSTPSIGEQLSYLRGPRQFKNPEYTKNINRRAKNLKNVLTQERERDRAERDRRMAEIKATGQFDTYGATSVLEMPSYSSMEAPPSLLPHKHYCDITGLEAPYTDPATGLRYHDKSVYDVIKTLSASSAKEYLAARGVSSIVK